MVENHVGYAGRGSVGKCRRLERANEQWRLGRIAHNELAQLKYQRKIVVERLLELLGFGRSHLIPREIENLFGEQLENLLGIKSGRIALAGTMPKWVRIGAAYGHIVFAERFIRLAGGNDVRDKSWPGMWPFLA